MQILKGQLFVAKFSESKMKTFLDYIAGGCELNFMVAIDFTGVLVNLAFSTSFKTFINLISN